MATDKHTLQGIVSEMTVPSIPHWTGPAATYLRLSNLYANQQIIVRLSNAQTSEVVFEFHVQASENSDPLQTHVIILKIPPFEIRRKGRCVFSAMHDEVAFSDSTITVK